MFSYDQFGNLAKKTEPDGRTWTYTCSGNGMLAEVTRPDQSRVRFKYAPPGLYYNRFRYYSPEEGCYTQQDPIGLAGGNPTIYGYVSDSNMLVDEFGLDCHHLATNKHSEWSDKFRELFKKNGIGKFKNGNWRKDVLNDPLNKVNVPGHKGPHPREMHEEIYRRLLKASNEGKDAFVKELQQLAKEAQQPGSWLNDILIKKK